MKEMTIREVQLVSLDILRDIHEFCVENDIKYSLSGGSLLGAIRHKGFIPWDDDIDLQMPQPDYYRFIHSYKSKKGYKLYSPEIEGCEDVRMHIAHVCDIGRTHVDLGPSPWTKEDVGIWVEIIPVFGAPDSEGEMEKHLKTINKYARKVNCWKTKNAKLSSIRRYKTPKEKLKFIARKILSPFYGRRDLMRLLEIFKKYNYEQSSSFFASPHYKMKEWQPKKNMESYMLHQFEDGEFYIMSGYNENLSSLYGSDYMIMPSESKRTMHYSFRYYWR